MGGAGGRPDGRPRAGCYTPPMRQETVTIADDLADLVEAFRRDHGEPEGFSSLEDAALRQYLRSRGYVPATEYRPLRLTPDERGSGKGDVSVEHDRYLYEATE